MVTLTTNTALPIRQNLEAPHGPQSARSASHKLAEIGNIQPKYQHARQALQLHPLKIPHVSSDKLLLNIEHPKHRSLFHHQFTRLEEVLLLSQNNRNQKREIQRDIAEKITLKINQSINEQQPLVNLDNITNEAHDVEQSMNTSLLHIYAPSCCTGSGMPRYITPERVHHYFERGLSAAKEQLKSAPEEEVLNLKAEIQNKMTELQYGAFLKNIPWGSVRETLTHELRQHFKTEDPLGQKHHDKVDRLIDEQMQRAPGYTTGAHGGRFESHKNKPNAKRLDATHIRTEKGNIYALINSPNTEQWAAIQKQHGNIVDQKGVLGTGSLGKVRLAEDTETHAIVAVKKISIPPGIDPKCIQQLVNSEVESMRTCRGSQYLLGLHDIAYTTGRNKNPKYYLFMPVAGRGDLFEFIDILYRRLAGDTLDLKTLGQYIFQASKRCVKAVAELHTHGLYHHDIKPENFFLNSAHDLKLGDFGFVSPMKTTFNHRGTMGYFPPEAYNTDKNADASPYRSDKHDAFSLGITLLSLKLIDQPDLYEDHHLTLLNQEVTLDFFPLPDNSQQNTMPDCKGYQGDCSQLKGETLDEVIALLIAADPNDRISAAEAAELPFFK